MESMKRASQFYSNQKAMREPVENAAALILSEVSRSPLLNYPTLSIS